MMIAVGFLIVLGYLCGSLPTGLLLTRMTTGEDVRARGSGNTGASNVARTAGFKIGAAVAVIDMLKGAIPVWIGWSVGVGHVGLALIAVAAVLGHDFSVFLAGKGGKGVATTLGVAVALAPLAALGGILVWVVVMLATRYSSVASLCSLMILTPLFWLSGAPPPFVWSAAALFVLGLAKHYENLGRLAQGNERKFARARPAGGG